VDFSGFNSDTMNKKLTTLFLLFSISSSFLYAQPRQGMQAYEVALPSLKGDTIKLSSLKGKVVLLDFWASWCKPCRASNKGLVKLYSKFKDKGFEILGVSLDEDVKDWKKAVTADKLTWPQVNDAAGWESSTVSKWGLYAIPTSYLIDQNGKLLAMDLEGKELEKALKELIGK
jgi:peroxiredoxin